MNALQTLLSVFDRIHVSSSEPARVKVRRAPVCESLEGRQLLNGAWIGPQGFPMWTGAPGTGAGPAAHVHSFALKGGPREAHAFDLHGAPKGMGGPGFAGHTFTKPSAQLQADFKTLQTDQKALLAEIPTSLRDAVKGDKTIIDKAFSTLTPAQRQAIHHDTTPPGGTSTGDPMANLTSDLTAAGVSSAQANQIIIDLQNLKNALTTTDPTLQAKIAADQAAIAKDGGPSLPANASGMGMPGMM